MTAQISLLANQSARYSVIFFITIIITINIIIITITITLKAFVSLIV